MGFFMISIEPSATKMACGDELAIIKPGLYLRPSSNISLPIKYSIETGNKTVGFLKTFFPGKERVELQVWNHSISYDGKNYRFDGKSEIILPLSPEEIAAYWNEDSLPELGATHGYKTNLGFSIACFRKKNKARALVRDEVSRSGGLELTLSALPLAAFQHVSRQAYLKPAILYP